MARADERALASAAGLAEGWPERPQPGAAVGSGNRLAAWLFSCHGTVDHHGSGQPRYGPVVRVIKHGNRLVSVP